MIYLDIYVYCSVKPNKIQTQINHFFFYWPIIPKSKDWFQNQFNIFIEMGNSYIFYLKSVRTFYTYFKCFQQK